MGRKFVNRMLTPARRGFPLSGASLARLMIPITQTSWQQILAELRRCDKEQLRAWLYDLDLPRLAGGVLTVVARNDAQVRHLERCRESVARCAQVTLGRLISLDIQLDSQQDDLDITCARSDGLRRKFTVRNFVAGRENQMAHAAALQVLQEPGGEYNPLFLHGPAGAGKTHLLQAICLAATDPPSGLPPWSPSPPFNKGGGNPAPVANPALNVVYVSASEFIARFTECFEEALPQRFRRRFLEADLVALDDVEVFAGKARSQEELFHVINGLLASGKQLVLAADRPPGAIAELEPRLVSRLNAGLVVAMDSPGVESRMRIIEQKNQFGCYECPPEALRQIAERCPPRELDSVLSRLDEIAQAHGGRVTMDLVDEVFRDQRGRPASLDAAATPLDNGVFA